jgi:hypothetical protein
VTSRVLIIVLGGVAVVGAVGALVLMNQRPKTAAVTEIDPPAATRTESPPLVISKPGPAKSSSAPRTTSAPAAPTPEPAPALGTLLIESDVPETSVFIDRVYLGNAPVTARNLTPGSHRLNMSVTGYEGVSETIEVEAGTHTISMKFKDIKLDEKVDVTHKHAVGSCSGTLRATPQRLTYETTHAGDAFAVALTNLDVFEIDYVQKNLKVKLKDGKTYNFTDSEGNADRLYLFQQAVEKVRQRLLAGRHP